MHSIIGIDCATQPEKVGLALARVGGPLLEIEQVAVGSRQRDPASIAAAWLADRDSVLLALDAPLGWPTELGHSLSQHRAGHAIAPSPDSLFHRHTDSELCKRLGKRPLEVGANLIARTAHAALALLAELRRRTGREIPLAWEPSACHGTAAIEVYPAATLMTRRFSNGPDCLELFKSEVRLPSSPLVASSGHARDAVICAIAGSDFLAGACVSPTDLGLAMKEGWIWARRTEA